MTMNHWTSCAFLCKRVSEGVLMFPAPPAHAAMLENAHQHKRCVSVISGLSHVGSQEHAGDCACHWELPALPPKWLQRGQAYFSIVILKLRSSNRDHWPYNTSSVAKGLMYCHHCNKLVFKHSLLCLSYLQIKNMALLSEIKKLFFTPYISSLCVFY